MLAVFDEIRRRRLLGVLALYFVGAWVVLQAAALVFPGWQIPDEAIRHVWIGAALVLPIAFLFSWRYDVTIEGIVRTSTDGDGYVALDRKDFLILSAYSVLALAIIASVAFRVLDMRSPEIFPQPVADVPQNSIAVLPFTNMSDDEENEYFSDGITEQLLHELARVPNLHVAARTSAFYFKNRNEDIRSIGQALGVRTVLEGSVRRKGNSLRITAQLIDADDGYHIWSKVFDAELTDIFVIQDEIASAIVESLRIRMGPGSTKRLYRPSSVTAETFDLYLEAMTLRAVRAPDALSRSNTLLEKVVSDAPDFALANAQLAFGYVLQSYFGGMSVEEASALAEPLLLRAEALEPDLEQTYDAWGLLFTSARRFEEANEAFEKALAINPGFYSARVNHGFSLVLQSRLQEASKSYLQAQALDPLNANLNFNLGALLMLMGDYDSGRMYMVKSLDIEPSNNFRKVVLGVWSRRYGQLAEAHRIAEEVLDADPGTRYLGMLRANLQLDFGNISEAREIIDEARKFDPDDIQLRETKIGVWLAEENMDALHAFADAQYALVDARPGDNLSALDRERVHRYGWASLMRGDNETAAQNFHWAAGGDEGIRSTNYDHMDVLKYLALAYRRMGRTQEAEALVEQCLRLAGTAHDNGWATPQLYYRLAEIHAVRGDVEDAASQLQAAYERGWRDIRSLETALFWRDLGATPEIERVKVKVYEDIERQRRDVTT
jgi:TolB-like protein/tetratricopeptide (TPR) repeat protein